jgi:hypothetical protein
MKTVTIAKEMIDSAAELLGGDHKLAETLDRSVRQIRNYRCGRRAQGYVLEMIEKIITEQQAARNQKNAS